MDIFDAIYTRRSVRQFTSQKVDAPLVEQLLKSAMSAPSAGNEQPWHFMVVQDQKLLTQIPNVHPYARMCLEAPLAIVVCADPALQKHPGFWVQDVAAATQNLLLAARGLGLGAVWLGVYPSDRVKGIQKLFKLPESIIPFCIVPMGYTTLTQIQVDRFKKERVHHNTW